MTVRVYLARWILPISSPPIANGAVAVEHERISWVGPASGAPAGLVADLGNVALMPGLVNAHSHVELTAMRGFLEDLPFRQWILRLTQSRQAVMTPARHLASARAGLAEGLLAGITTFGDVSDAGYSLDAMLQMGVRGVMFQEVFGPDPAQCGEAIDALRVKVASLRARTNTFVQVGVSPHAPYTVSDALFRATAAFARDESLPITIHIAESQAEHDLVTRGQGDFAHALRARGIGVVPRAATPIALLHDTGVLAARPALIHAIHVGREDLGRIADSGSRVVHCPASNAKLGHGTAPVDDMRTRGIPVGLGTDSVASSNRMDLLDECRLASLQQRSRLQNPAALPAREVLEWATLGGAQALGLERDVGSLDTGKLADLVAFPLEGARDTPVFAPEEALVFGAAGRRPRLVMVQGKELVRDGLLLADVRQDLAIVNETAAALIAFQQSA
ncbi:MAG: amidohydrolase family protein [Gemmatimonadaceae bacterium]